MKTYYITDKSPENAISYIESKRVALVNIKTIDLDIATDSSIRYADRCFDIDLDFLQQKFIDCVKAHCCIDFNSKQIVFQ